MKPDRGSVLLTVILLVWFAAATVALGAVMVPLAVTLIEHGLPSLRSRAR
jgi:hypothetical protein